MTLCGQLGGQGTGSPSPRRDGGAAVEGPSSPTLTKPEALRRGSQGGFIRRSLWPSPRTTLGFRAGCTVSSRKRRVRMLAASQARLPKEPPEHSVRPPAPLGSLGSTSLCLEAHGPWGRAEAWAWRGSSRPAPTLCVPPALPRSDLCLHSPCSKAGVSLHAVARAQGQRVSPGASSWCPGGLLDSWPRDLSVISGLGAQGW